MAAIMPQLLVKLPKFDIISSSSPFPLPKRSTSMNIPQNTPKAVSRLRDLLLVKVRTTSSSRSMSNISFIVVFSCYMVCVFLFISVLG